MEDSTLLQQYLFIEKAINKMLEHNMTDDNKELQMLRDIRATLAQCIRKERIESALNDA